jgi:C4-dicarboxylate-binding protein DctP
MGWGDGGTYQVANSVRPVTSLEDIKGIKIRVPEIEADIEFFKAAGASPIPISFSETFTSLEQGVVDGLELPVELMYASRLMEPVKYLTLTGHSESIFPVLMSMKLWNKLTPDQQKIVMDGMKVQIETNRELAQEAETKYIEEFKKMGGEVHVLTDEARQEFIKVGKQIQERFAPNVGTDLIELAKSFNK